jgi:hypothetical protein
VAATFGVSHEPVSGWSRIDGHLFFVLARAAVKKGTLTLPACQPRPAETAFVIVSDGDTFEYLGVARYDEDRDCWRLRALDR